MQAAIQSGGKLLDQISGRAALLAAHTDRQSSNARPHALMRIRTIQVQAGRTIEFPNGGKGGCRPSVTLTADLADGDDASTEVKSLQVLAEQLVEDHVDQLSAFVMARHQVRKAKLNGRVQTTEGKA